MKKNHIKTNSIRTIKKSFHRFLSLIIMSLLGVLVYVGLSSTSPDMLNTLDKLFDESNTYDIKIISSMGLTDEDIDEIKKLNSISDIEGSYSVDVLIEKDEKESVINISSLPQNINKVELIEGRLPENEFEIVVEENFLKKVGFNINDKLTIESDNLKNNELIIVGTIRSPLYFSNTAINQNRGTTTIGTGTINYYAYQLSSNFEVDYYSSIYLTTKEANKYITSKKQYLKLIKNSIDELESIKSIQENNRYNSLYNEANAEIITNENKAYKELEEAKEKLDNANKELTKAKKELNSSNQQLTNFKQELASAKKALDKGKKEFNDTLKKYNINKISESLKEINDNIFKIENLLKYLDHESEEYNIYYNQLISLNSQKELLQTLKNTEETLTKSQKQYDDNYSLYQSSFKKYQSGLKEYNKNLNLYNKSLKEYESSKEEVEKEINEAKEKLKTISHPTWYINERKDDQTYSSYINQTESIKNLSALFPVVFYAVAILVSLISMNRMVEDDRGEIGTLKSLGFTNHEIKSKYLLFSFVSTIIGAIIGTILGLTIIPYLIFTIYRLLFDLPSFQLGLNISSIIIGFCVAIICICGASIITANRILKEKPASLMRPKAPKSGKKILLENINWLWHKLKFSNKITIRNILRYKKRVSVTIFGICGCTALMLCGFGIKDSIVDITNMQYVNTFKYDATVYTHDLDINEIPNIIDNEFISDYIVTETITGTYKESNVNLLVTENNEDLSKIVNLVSENNENNITLEDNKVIITDKLADIYKIKKGDSITILDSEKKSYTFEVSNIVKNYLGHYIYLNKETLEKNNIDYNPNVIYLNTYSELTSEEENKLSNQLLKNDSIINVIHTSALVDSAQDMLNSLDKVIVILVLLSAMLSFVVLYNLSNININERTREIATLKVLGFYDKEVDNYITKETIILTIIGIALGLGFGYVLTNLTISTVEMETARFIRNISLKSYIYTTIISSLFTLIVNFVTHFTLKKINMIESLKSVE